MKRFSDPGLKAVFDSYPAAVKAPLLRLRQLILETAAEMPEVGELEETLKWGQPAWLTSKSKSGTTIRIDQIGDGDQYALYVHCQTSLLATWRDIHGDDLQYTGNRGLIFDAQDDLPEAAVRTCIAQALTYHKTY